MLLLAFFYKPGITVLMLIQTQTTPNPNTLKFLLEAPLRLSIPRDFAHVDEAIGKSLLARRLFGLDGVARVFLAPEFVSITKNEEADWAYLKTLVLHALGDFLLTGLSPVDDDEGETLSTTDDDPIIQQIKELLEAKVRPAVEQDGGDIVFERFEEGVLYLSMRGSCSGCPSSTATLKNGIENMMKHYIPEVLEVRAA
jgi:Fe-S cluster biogenesis protein NfuA